MKNNPGSGWGKPVNVPSTPDTSTKADWVKTQRDAVVWEHIEKQNAAGVFKTPPASIFSLLRECKDRLLFNWLEYNKPLVLIEYIKDAGLPIEEEYFVFYVLASGFLYGTKDWERLLFYEIEKERRKLEALGVKELLTIELPEQKAVQTEPGKEQQDVIGLVGIDGLTKNQLVLLFHLFLQRYETAPKNTRTRIVAQFLHLLTRKPWNSSTSDFKKLVSRGTEAKDVNTSIKDLDRVKGLFEKYKLKDLAEAAEQEKGKVLKGQEGT